MDKINKKLEKINIIQHKDPEPLRDFGDILYPFVSWETSTTGGKWYSKVPENFYVDKSYLLMSFVGGNAWDATIKLGINSFDFKESVRYECPYNKYLHYWSIPVALFTDDIKFWTKRYNNMFSEIQQDDFWMKKFHPIKTKNGLPFTKIQRALLGPGYTVGTLETDGSCYLYDAIVALDNGDFLGVKVWMWFNK